MTNAEKIRNMSDEELEDMVFGARHCPPGLDYYDCNSESPCKDCRLQWLREDENETV